ncbi:MAG: LPS export ABC transporter periplasmic protein LptC [Ferruginibacter sp.]
MKNVNTINGNIHILHLFKYRYSFFTAIGIAVVLMYGCSDKPNIKNDLDRKKTTLEEAHNVNVNYTQGGRLKAILHSPLMLRVQDTMPYTEFPKTIHVDFYNGDTLIESRLDAKYCKYIESRNLILMRDSVKVISTNGDTLLCNELYWDKNRVGLEFHTNTPVIVKTKTNIIYGQKGMELSQDLKSKNFYEVTNSIMRVPASQFPD